MTVFLVLVAFAAHVMLHLYATSVVTAAAFDAARVVAGSDGGPAAVSAAEQDARRLLGPNGRRARFQWDLGDETVGLRVRMTRPGAVLPGLGRWLGMDELDRTVRVRLERFR